MSVKRIWGVLQQELFITKNSVEVIMDLPFFSVMSVIVFGYFSLYLSESMGPARAYSLLFGIMFWEVIRVNQYSMSVSALWNVWSKNLSNMFISPLTIGEYITAQIFSASIKSLIIFILISFIASVIFSFDILEMGLLNLTIYFLNLAIFSWAVGIMILGIIFRYGTRIQALAWGMIFLLQPLTAVFYPVDVLPPLLQKVAWIFPSTYIFEAGRFNLTNSVTRWDLLMPAFILNVVYFLSSLVIFNWLFDKSRLTGRFAKNES